MNADDEKKLKLIIKTLDTTNLSCYNKQMKTKTYKYDFSFNFRVLKYPALMGDGFGIHEVHYEGKKIVYIHDTQSLVGNDIAELGRELNNRKKAFQSPVLDYSKYFKLRKIKGEKVWCFVEKK